MCFFNGAGLQFYQLLFLSSSLVTELSRVRVFHVLLLLSRYLNGVGSSSSPSYFCVRVSLKEFLFNGDLLSYFLPFSPGSLSKGGLQDVESSLGRAVRTRVFVSSGWRPPRSFDGDSDSVCVYKGQKKRVFINLIRDQWPPDSCWGSPITLEPWVPQCTTLKRRTFKGGSGIRHECGTPESKPTPPTRKREKRVATIR